jgi:hypothetical protein
MATEFINARCPSDSINIMSFENTKDASGDSEEPARLSPVCYLRAEAPREMLFAAEAYERKYQIRFETLTYFSTTLMNELHRAEGDPTWAPKNVTVASRSDETILRDVDVLSDVVNSDHVALGDRERYYNALKSIYRKLPSYKTSGLGQTLRVGIEREGGILAEAMGWLAPGHGIRPDAKRVPYKSGLLVGLSELPPLQSYASCLIVDGAIASGATLITLIEKLRAVTRSFHINSVHSSYEGIRAVTRFCRSKRVDLTITVGHATAGLNSKYYAVDSADTKRIVVGDVGDMISEFAK